MLKVSPNLSELSVQDKDALIVRLFAVVEDLRARMTLLEAENQALRLENQELRGKLAKNSQNSSKPPSTDGYQKPKPKSLRKPSGKKSGGQKGHPGARLERVEKPDHTIIHPVAHCQECGHSLKQRPASGHRSRQVIDLPPLKLEVTEHQVELKECPHCKFPNEAAFPAEAKTSVQYGSRIKSLLVYLNQYQLLPYERTVQLAEDLFSQAISQGTLYAWNTACFEHLESTEERIRQAILASEVVHFDETGLRSQGKLHWLHAASTEQLTFYGLHARRGQEAMLDLGLLEHYTGCAVHDHWKSYFTFSCDHSLCNAHHLRELTYLVEQEKQGWAKSMTALLLEAKKASESTPENCLAEDSSVLESILLQYDGLIQEGLAQNIPPPEVKPKKKKRGRLKQSKAKNLLDRLHNFKENALAFLTHPLIPFDNNQGERDIRMAKLKQKISGCFRGQDGGKIFSRIRGYVSTLRKNDLNILEGIQSAFDKSPILPAFINAAE
jgi:transposase